MGSFVYPLAPAARTAVLTPWFRTPAGLASIERSGPIRIFPEGWGREAAEFAPAAIAGTLIQIRDLARWEIPSLSHAIVVLQRPGGRCLMETERDWIWERFHVPSFEQIIGLNGELLAGECEAHDGLHAETTSHALENEVFDFSCCPCGHNTPRIRVLRGAALERRIAAYAR